MVKTKAKKPKKKTTSQLKKKLDKIFSEYIRRKDAKNGIATCVTCGKKAHWKELQNGHYVSRSYLATRFDETNCHVQCCGCNIFKKGNMDSYALFMINKYGVKHLEELEKSKQIIIRYFPYEEKIEEYTAKLLTLK